MTTDQTLTERIAATLAPHMAGELVEQWARAYKAASEVTVGVLDFDLTACVERVARAAYEATRSKHTANGYTSATWEQVTPMTKHAIREQVLPLVAATVAFVRGEK